MFDWFSLTLLAAVTTAILFGGMVYFAAVFAPVVFRHLPADVAGGLVRRVFPVYYLVGLLLAGLAGLAALPGRPIEGAVLLAVAVGFFWARQILMPRINTARDAGANARFSRLHRFSVTINMVQLVAAAVVLVVLMLAL